MSFCTAISCMDGRIQLPVINYLQKKYSVEYVDTITEPGPNLILHERKEESIVKQILKRVDISVNKHDSKSIAIIGHHDCAGNPVSIEEQLDHIRTSVNFIKSKYENLEIIGLWVDENWEVSEI